MTTSDKTDPHYKSLQHLYGAFAASIFIQFVPNIYLQIFSVCLLLAVMIMAYVYRSKAEENSLMGNHATYIIRTIWLWSLFFSVGVVAALPWFYYTADHSVIYELMEHIYSGRMVSEEIITDALQDYQTANQANMIKIALITIGPSMVYCLYRLAKGVTRALKGYRIANVKSWL